MSEPYDLTSHEIAGLEERADRDLPLGPWGCRALEFLIADVRRRRAEPCGRQHVDEVECTCDEPASKRGGEHYSDCPFSLEGFEKLRSSA